MWSFPTHIQLILITPDHGIETLQTSLNGTSTLDSAETVGIEFSIHNDDASQAVILSASFTTDAATRTVNFSHSYASDDVIMGPGSIGLIANAPNRTPTWDDISVTGQAVPEPASLALLGVGAMAMIHRRRRA
ncbi:MAG TPA: PEP-CTERM sorting domain-containing protein [Phycisphaeraceae bacterium]